MADHFLITNWARDVVISGQIDPLREVLTALADHDYGPVQSGGWERSIAQLQAAARVAARAPNLRIAAKGVAAMGRVCGDCHRTSGGGPNFSVEATDVSLPYAESFPDRMGRHMWAAELLWYGIVTPSDSSWEAGALALADARAELREWLPDEFAVALENVRKLGEQAQRAKTLEQRGDVYAQMVTTCASCHSRWLEYGL